MAENSKYFPLFDLESILIQLLNLWSTKVMQVHSLEMDSCKTGQ